MKQLAWVHHLYATLPLEMSAANAYVNYRKSNWVELVNNMHQLVTEQIKEVEKAVIGMGEYKFRLAYNHLELPSKKWFLMTTEQGQQHLKEVIDILSVSLEDTSTSSSSIVPGTTNTRTLYFSRKLWHYYCVRAFRSYMEKS